MIKKVSITNPKGEVLDIELANPIKAGLAISAIEGLGPPQATINGQELATEDGMMYSSARASYRQLIFTVYMLRRDATSPYGALSIEESRHLTYKYFPLKKKIRITVQTDVQTLYCDGYVESNEPTIFSENEFTTISVLCPDPYWYKDGQDATIFSGVRSEFEFPWSSEIEGANTLVQFSSLWKDAHAILWYNGTVDTGVTITIHALTGGVENIRIYNVDTEERMTIDTSRIVSITGEELTAGDAIIINTTRQSRSCMLLRKGVYTSILGSLNRDSDWFQISNGANGFAFTADSGADNLSLTFGYKSAFVGV